MGRYTTRFEGGGSNAVGATYTAAAGGGNSKFAVAANGQILNRTDYPALSAYYSGQSQFATFNLDGLANNATTSAISFGQADPSSKRSTVYGGGEVAATFSGFTIYIQAIQNRDNTSQRNSCIWYTTNGEDWKLTDLLSPPVGRNASFITTSSAIYLCHESGLLRSTDGLNFTGVYTTGVRGLTELNGTVIFSTGGTNVLKTTDFNTFTSINLSGANVHSLVNYSGNLYTFTSGSTGVRYSTDTGTTWQSATSGLVTSAGNGVKEIAGYLLVSASESAGNAIYQYSTNPTGTTNTWTQSNVSKSAGYDSHVTHYLYDSTHNVLMCAMELSLQGTPSQGIIAFRVTGVTGTAVAYSGSNTDLTYYYNQYDGYKNYPFLFQSGSMRRIHINYLCSYDPPQSNWRDSGNPNGEGRIILDGGLSGIRPNPFFRPLIWGEDGWYTLGTTNSGNRYTANYNGYSYGYTTYSWVNYFALYVEESGFFKPLKASSTGHFANISPGSTSVFASLPSRPSFILNEASGRYLAAWTWTGTSITASEAGIYYNSYLQSTKRSTGNVQLYNNYNYVSWATTASTVGGTKSDGIYVVQNTYNTAGSTQEVFHVNPTGGITPIAFTPRFNGSFPQTFFSDVDNEIIISQWSTTNVTGTVLTISGGTIKTSGIYTLINSTGGILSTINSGSCMVKSEGKYYVFDSSGNTYVGTSPTSLSFLKTSVGSTNLNLSSNYMVFREIGSGLVYGTLGVQFKFGQLDTTFQTRANGSYSIYGKNRAPEYFKFSGNSYYIETPGYNDPTTFTTQSGVFVVPNIVSTTTGESKYIIAR